MNEKEYEVKSSQGGYCQRHPDRFSNVTCQRCGRPVCPECQRPASVGVHCVDCVTQANRNTPVVRTIFGAHIKSGKPWATISLIAACVLVFVLQLATGGTALGEVTQRFAFSPAAAHEEPWRFITAAFLHGSLLHLFFNMYALWLVGSYLEQLFGIGRFVSLYVLGAVGGNIGMVIWAAFFASPAAGSSDFSVWQDGSYGASGAIFGLFGAMLPAFKKLGQNAVSILVIVALNLVLGIVVTGIAWQAHVGGLVVGLAIGAAYAYAPRGKHRLVAVVSVVGMAAVLAACALWLYAGYFPSASVPGLTV